MTLGIGGTPNAQDEQQDRGSRGWLWWLIPGLAVAVLVAGAVVWRRLASSYRVDLHVVLARPVTCTGATVGHRARGFEGLRFDVVSVRAGMLCVVVVRFTNAAPVSLHLGSASFPLLGPSTGGTAELRWPHQDFSA